MWRQAMREARNNNKKTTKKQPVSRFWLRFSLEQNSFLPIPKKRVMHEGFHFRTYSFVFANADIPRFTLFESVFKQKKSFIFLCSRQRYLLASACWRGQSYRGDVLLVAIPKWAEIFGKFPPIANTMYLPQQSQFFLLSDFTDW